MRMVRNSRPGRVSACLGAVFAICLALIIAPDKAAAAEVDQWLAGVFGKSSASSGRSNVGGPSEERRQGRRNKGSDGSSSGSGFGSFFGGGGDSDKVRYVASSGCLSSNLSGVISSVSAYGSVTVSSTCRSHSHNASVGGAPKSHHLTGDAADFRVHGNYEAAYAHLRSIHGGAVHHYGGGLFHIDNGEKRSW